MLIAKLFFIVASIAVFIVGLHYVRHFERIFGGSATAVPSENESGRFLNKMQLVMLWILSLKLFIMMAIIL